MGGTPPKGPLGPKKGPKTPFFVHSKGVPLVCTIYVHVSVRKMPFVTLKFPRASENRGLVPYKGSPRPETRCVGGGLYISTVGTPPGSASEASEAETPLRYG